MKKKLQIDEKLRSKILESLSTLYLRLNGYFTTGLVLHRSTKDLDTELDIVAVRFPNHSQEETEHNSSPYLEVPNHIDILIAEVKANGKPLQMNKPLHEDGDIATWKKILNWIGVFSEGQIDSLSKDLQKLATPVVNSKLQKFKSVEIETSVGKVTIRLIMFSPERINVNNADKFVNWGELNEFIWTCLCPSKEREKCGVNYDFTAWGLGLTDIVQVYKNRKGTQNKFDSIDDLYSDIIELKAGKNEEIASHGQI